MHQQVFKRQDTLCTLIRQDRRHRKAYLVSGDNKMVVINIQSGVILKHVFEEEDQQTELLNN